MSSLRTLGGFAVSSQRRKDVYWELRRRALGEPALPEGSLDGVLVVCHGNICRSPFAEALLSRLRPGLAVVSAGLEAGEGDPADPAAIAAAAEFGLSLVQHRARRVSTALASQAELILAMEGHQLSALRDRFPEHASRARLLGDFLPTPPHRIPDPYGREPQFFQRTFALIERALEGLAERMDRRGIR